MRVTRETLIRLAKETAQTRSFENKDIIAAYLSGSLVGEGDPFLGGVTDIDLVFVMANKPQRTREIVKLTGDFHVDIHYRARAEYTPARDLRINPWLGPEIYAPMLLLEREKFFDFVQAAVRAGFEFNAPSLTLQRCRALLRASRKMWTELLSVESVGAAEVARYLNALYHAACAVTGLNGGPLAERRLLLDFPTRAEQADRPQMASALIGLLGGFALESGLPPEWLTQWRAAFESAASSSKADAYLNPARTNYYFKAFEAMHESGNSTAALWPLLNSWTQSALVLPAEQNKDWDAARSVLGFNDKDFEAKVGGLDQFLDEIEALLDEIALANGLDTSTSL